MMDCLTLDEFELPDGSAEEEEFDFAKELAPPEPEMLKGVTDSPGLSRADVVNPAAPPPFGERDEGVGDVPDVDIVAARVKAADRQPGRGGVGECLGESA